jgi:TonB family protein
MKPITTMLFAILVINMGCVRQSEVHPSKVAEEIVVTDEEGDYYMFVDSMPVYPGGDKALGTWVGQELKYPIEAQERKIEGIVYVSFIIDTDGSIESARIVRGVHPLLDEEALRIARGIRGFIPGYQDGKPVRVQFTIPLRFKL